MGTVYRAEVAGPVPGLEAGSVVALKVIHAHLLSQPGFFKRFLREAQIGQEVRHENVVRTYDCDATEAEGKAAHFLVMEYVEGQTLRDLLRELGQVPEELCRHIGMEVARGLAAIHDVGAVHRDLKPENVLITRDHVVKVMDLGVARLQDEAVRLSRTGAFLGSLAYAAPEQFQGGGRALDARADLYALGVVLYELATGQHPYAEEETARLIARILRGEPRRLGEVVPQLSPFLEELVHTLLAKKPEARFARAGEVAGALCEGESGAWWLGRVQAGRAGTPHPLRRVVVPRETAVYGRDDDLAALHELYERARGGEGQVLLLQGEAGIGKTRLVDEFVGRLARDGEEVHFLCGSYPPGGAATASAAIAEAFRTYFGPEALDQALAKYVVKTPLLGPAFAALLRGDARPEGAEPLTQQSLQTVLANVTHALAEERPTIVFVDDLHFAPPDGRALFASLALAARGRPILLIGSMRPGLPETWIADLTRVGNVTCRTLRRLGAKDHVLLLQEAFRSERLARELATRIALKSDGNPFFTFEIIRGLREGQLLTKAPDGTWVTTRDIENIQVPSSVLDLVNARVADLEEADRDLLDVASCYGFEFDPLVVSAAVGLETIPALKRLARVERMHRLVRAKGARYVFDHHQVHEALLGSLSDPLRRAYHVAIGRAMEPTLEREPGRCVALCEHLLRGGDGERAVGHLGDALRILQDAQDIGAAVGLRRMALQEPGLLVGPARIDHLIEQHGMLQVLGDADDEHAVLDEALELATSLGDGERVAKATYLRGWHEYLRGNVDEALGHATRALDLANRLQLPDVAMQALGDIGTFHFAKGDLVEAEVWMQRGLDLASREGAERSMGAGFGNLGNLRLVQGRLEEAASFYERGVHHLQAAGEPLLAATIQGGTAAVALMRGRLGDALAARQRELRIDEELGARRYACVSECEVARVLLWLGDLDGARESVERALRTAEQVRDPTLGPFGVLVRGMTHEFAGDLDAAEAAYREALAGHRAVGNSYGMLGALCALGSLEAREGDLGEARALLEEARDTARPMGATFADFYASGRLDLLPGGDPDAVRARIEHQGAGADLTDVLELRYLLWQAEGRREDLAEAKRLLDHLVEHAPEEYRESMRRNVRLNREVTKAWAEHGGERSPETAP